jgi:alkylation response protein AidB-like acyl-CoA dehydrogenase
MSDFSLALNEDQLTLQKWLHEFAVDVMRPNAEEWDEREEFPWPIVEQAAEIGLYSWEFMAEMMMNDPTGISMVMAIEEIFWGDAGIGMAIMGSGLAAAGIAASGTPEQVMEWVPQCYSDGSKINTGAFAASEPDAGSDVNGYRLSAKYDEAKDEWVLNGTKAWITNGGMADIHVVVAVVDPELGSKGHASFIVPPGTAGLTQGQKYKKHGIKASHTAEVVLDDVRVPATVSSAARRSSTSASPRSVGARRAMPRPPCRPSRPPGRPSAHRPSASPVPPRNTRPSTPRSATRSASRSS